MDLGKSLNWYKPYFQKSIMPPNVRVWDGTKKKKPDTAA